MADILIAADTPNVYREVAAVVSGAGTTVRWVRNGQDVRPEHDRQPANLVVVDMQIGTMGGIAVALDLRLEADAGRLLPCSILVLLDRRADVFMARRSGVDGWLVKPLDPVRVRRATAALLEGGTYYDPTLLPEPVVVASS